MGSADHERPGRRIDGVPEHVDRPGRDDLPGHTGAPERDDLPQFADLPGPLLVDWDYVLILDWPEGDDDLDLPDPEAVISPPLTQALRRWSTAMQIAYDDETGAHDPDPEEADALDAEYDRLVARLRATGLAVDQGEKWWRAP